VRHARPEILGELAEESGEVLLRGGRHDIAFGVVVTANIDAKTVAFVTRPYLELHGCGDLGLRNCAENPF
jgi:hypothetical protein